MTKEKKRQKIFKLSEGNDQEKKKNMDKNRRMVNEINKNEQSDGIIIQKNLSPKTNKKNSHRSFQQLPLVNLIRKTNNRISNVTRLEISEDEKSTDINDFQNKLQKKEQIIDNLQKIIQRNKQRYMINKASNKQIQNIFKKKQLYQIMEEDYKRVQSMLLQQKLQLIKNKSQLSFPQIKQHQIKYLKQKKERTSKNIINEKNDFQKSVWSKILEKQKKQKEQKQKQLQKLPHLYHQKIKLYQQQVLKNRKPKSNPKLKFDSKSINHNIGMKFDRKQINDIGNIYLDYVKNLKKKTKSNQNTLNTNIQKTQSQRHSLKLSKLRNKRKISNNYLQQVQSALKKEDIKNAEQIIQKFDDYISFNKNINKMKEKDIDTDLIYTNVKAKLMLWQKLI